MPRATQAACHATWQPHCRTSRPNASWPCSRRVSASSTLPQFNGAVLPLGMPFFPDTQSSPGCGGGPASLHSLAEEGIWLCLYPPSQGQRDQPGPWQPCGQQPGSSRTQRLAHGLLLFPSLPFPQSLRLMVHLQPTHSQQSPCSQAMYQVETWSGSDCLE